MNTIVKFNEPTANARLPANYEQAKQALAECVSIDECKTWADKASDRLRQAVSQNLRSSLTTAIRCVEPEQSPDENTTNEFPRRHEDERDTLGTS